MGYGGKWEGEVALPVHGRSLQCAARYSVTSIQQRAAITQLDRKTYAHAIRQFQSTHSTTVTRSHLPMFYTATILVIRRTPQWQSVVQRIHLHESGPKLGQWPPCCSVTVRWETVSELAAPSHTPQPLSFAEHSSGAAELGRGAVKTGVERDRLSTRYSVLTASA